MKIISSVLSIVGLNLIQVMTDFAACFPMRNSTDTEVAVTNAVEELGRKISHAQWAKNPNKNVVLSPLSISVILNLLMLGSNGISNLELRKAVNYPNYLEEEEIHETFKNVILSLQQPRRGAQVSLHTGLFSRKGSEILDSFSNVSKNWYFTETQNLDFRGSPIVATERVNSWISNCTKGKISKAFSLQLNPDTIFLVYSVIYLDAKWENKFDVKLTKNGTFNTGKENITIPMMTSEMKILYISDDVEKFEMISLPYEGKRYSMFILKPMCDAAISKLIHIENSMSASYLDSLIDKMTTERISVTIPRMRLSQTLNLQMDLRSLGVSQIFSRNSANFKRLSENQRLFVSEIFHKAVLDVTEGGTSDASLSEYTIPPTSPPEKFIVDRPSLLFVRNNENGLVLFWAKLIKPKPLEV